MDRVSVSRNVQGSMDKNSSAPPWRDTGQQTEFPCPEMCRGPWIKTPGPLLGGIWANGWSFHVQQCAGIPGYKLWCPSLEGYRPTDRVSMSGNVQGSVDKNPVPLPGGIRGNGQRFRVRKCAGVHG